MPYGEEIGEAEEAKQANKQEDSDDDEYEDDDFDEVTRQQTLQAQAETKAKAIVQSQAALKASGTSKETLAAQYRPDKIIKAGSSKKVDVLTEKGSVAAGSSKKTLNKIDEGREQLRSSSKEEGVQSPISYTDLDSGKPSPI